MNEEKKNTWLKFVVGAGAGYLGLEIATSGNLQYGVCRQLSEARWSDFGNFVRGLNLCAGGAYLYVGAAFVVSYYLCGYLTEKRRRPIVGACVGLAAGVLVACLAAVMYFHHLFG
jgi:hypothetical protein